MSVFEYGDFLDRHFRQRPERSRRFRAAVPARDYQREYRQTDTEHDAPLNPGGCDIEHRKYTCGVEGMAQQFGNGREW